MQASRRKFLKRAGVLAAAGAVGGSRFARLARAVTQRDVTGRLKRPNILIIMNDEERHWTRIENLVAPALLGSETNAAPGTFRSQIPGRMQLRNRGVRFSNYYTPTAPCSPARGVFYTGHHAPDTQVVDNMDFDVQASLNADIPTIADVLGRARYYCAYKGKVHLAKDADLRTADDMLARYGFNDWQGPSRLGDSEGPLAGALRDNDIAGYAAGWLSSTAGEKNAAGQPWLLTVNFINPHDIMLVDIDSNGTVQLPQGQGAHAFPLAAVPARDPYYYWWDAQKPANFSGQNGYTPETSGPRPQILDEFASLLSAIFGNIPLDDTARAAVSVYIENAQPARGTRRTIVPLWQAYLNYYLNCVVDNDRAVKRVLNALTDNGLQNTTIVLCTADHGELALSHMGKSRYFDAAARPGYEEPDPQAPTTVMPLRQKGPFVYQENNNLPLIVANLSTNTDALVAAYVPTIAVDVPVLASAIDIVPTLLHWAGLTHGWYRRNFARTTHRLGMRRSLPGVSLHAVIRSPGSFTSARWADGINGRDWVLFTSDAINALDADYAYLVAWDRCTGSAPNATKRGMLRGLYNGRHKYVRYFSPLDYQLNGDEFVALDYIELTTAGAYGQDIQLFDLSTDLYETFNTAADSGAPVSVLNQTLLKAMQRELSATTRVPTTVQNLINGATDPCA